MTGGALSRPADLVAQEREAQRGEGGALLVVLAVAVAAGGGLVQVGLVAHRLQLGGHLARVAGMHAIVLARGGDQDRRIAVPRLGLVIGRVGLQEGPVLRLVGVAVLGDPAGAGQQLAVAAHVDQRDGAEQGAEPLGVAGQHVGDQDAAVRAALGGDALRTGHAAAHEIGGDGGEIVMRQRLLGEAPGIVPARAELAAAANVGRHAGAAALEPQLADGGAVVGQLRDGEAAVAVQVHRRISGLAGRADLHVGNALAVDRDRFVPRDDQPIGIERARRLLEHGGRLAAFDQRHRGRRERVLRVGEQIAVALRLLRVETPDIDNADLGQTGQLRARPAAGRWRRDLEHGFQFVEDRHDQLSFAPEEMLQGATFGRFEQHREIARFR